MENISYDALEKIGYKGYLLPKDAPEKVLQFGEGNFLRAFVDRFFDMGNEATGWNGKVVMVQPISGAFGFADGINAQDDLYTVLVRGKENGNTVDESRVISACSRCLNPYREDDYRAMMEVAVSDDLEIIVSNTTEAGIAYDPSCKADDMPPASFPAKLAQVLHTRSVELAKKFRVNLEVVSSLERKPGTKVKEVTKVEKTNIAGVAKDTSIARVALIGLQHNPGVAFQVFDLLSKHNINVDVILQSIGREDTKDITFTVHKKDLEESKQILEEHKETLRFDHIETDESIGKVSIVGAGLMSNCGVAARMFEALYEAGINIQMINTSEIRVSVLLDEEDVNRAVRAIHDKFFGEI